MKTLQTLALVPLFTFAASAQQHDHTPDDCGFADATHAVNEVVEARRNGSLPSAPRPPRVSPRPQSAALEEGDVIPPATSADFFLYEDSGMALVNPIDLNGFVTVLSDATNAMMQVHGDAYDYVGFFMTFEPSISFGAASLIILENSTTGLGIDIMDLRPDLGLSSEQLEAWLLMYNLNGIWDVTPGGPFTITTRLVMMHESEHLFGVQLPPLANGLNLQGIEGCGGEFHWDGRVDGQGGALGIGEWTGTNPATPVPFPINFNSDIVGGMFSYTDLYLMGMVSPAEMDAGNSELRYMENAYCIDDPPYIGTIFDFTSADIIATAGQRVPNSIDSQKEFRTAWVIIHQPGAPPTAADLVKAATIVNNHSADWNLSTLGRSTMQHTLEDPIFEDLGEALAGSAGTPSLSLSGASLPGEIVTFDVASGAPGSLAVHVAGLTQLSANFKGGVLVPSPDLLFPPKTLDGSGATQQNIPYPSGISEGTRSYHQFWILDGGTPSGFAATNAMAIDAL